MEAGGFWMTLLRGRDAIASGSNKEVTHTNKLRYAYAPLILSEPCSNDHEPHV